MTVAVFEGGAAEGAGSSRAVAARQSRPTAAQMGRGGGPRGGQARVINARVIGGGQGPRGPSGPQGKPAGKPRPERKRPEPKSRRKEKPVRVQVDRQGQAPPNYQAVIAAEYVAATLLVVISPVATRKAQVSPTSGKLSPYLPSDIIKIFAIGMVYLILEGLAAGPRGLARFSAWFGFLILIGVGLSEVSRIADIFKVISGAEYNPVKLTGGQAPASKGGATIPPLGQAGATAPPPPKGTTGG